MTTKILFRTVSILWIIWGLVHILAGVLTISQDAPASIASIADAVNPAAFHSTYDAATNALINQHGFNLLWIGLTTTIAAFFVWQNSLVAALVAGFVGGLADIGYFIFMDLGGFVHFVPGTVMTIVSASAISISIWLWLNTTNTNDS